MDNRNNAPSNNNKNNNANSDGNGKPKKKNKRVFVRTFSVTLFILAALTVTGWFVLSNIPGSDDILGAIIKPPSLAADNTANPSAPPAPPDTNAASVVPVAPSEDANDSGPVSQAPEGFTNNDRKDQFYTFLIFGTDNGVNTDTIMVGSYDGVNKKANIISIPRDSEIDSTFSPHKINAAFEVGTYNGGGFDGGVARLQKEIKKIIGFVPDYYICIDLNAFVELVDAVGGVDVNVSQDMVYDDPYQNLHINLKAGDQLLDGQEAMGFARYRHGNDPNDPNYAGGEITAEITDYGRIKNQQQVINAMLQNMMKPENYNKIDDYISIFEKYVKTNIATSDMAWFAKELLQIKDKGPDALSMYTIPTDPNGSGYPLWYEYILEPETVKLVNDTINPYTKDISADNLDIVN